MTRLSFLKNEMALIEARALEKIYENEGVRTPALKGVSLSVAAGEFVAVMGPSGSGKSTLLHILGFLDQVTKGEYHFDGKKIEDYSSHELAAIRNRQVGFVFQAFNLLARATVLENVKLPLLYSEKDEASWDRISREAIGQVGLSERISHESSQLSGGEKQRVAIARALVNDPKVILADEPTGNLDSKSGEGVMEILARLQKTEGRTILLVTHEDPIAAYAERIIRLLDGRVESDFKVERRREVKT